jgi:hypothetical protein
VKRNVQVVDHYGPVRVLKKQFPEQLGLLGLPERCFGDLDIAWERTVLIDEQADLFFRGWESKLLEQLKELVVGCFHRLSLHVRCVKLNGLASACIQHLDFL